MYSHWLLGTQFESEGCVTSQGNGIIETFDITGLLGQANLGKLTGKNCDWGRFKERFGLLQGRDWDWKVNRARERERETVQKNWRVFTGTRTQAVQYKRFTKRQIFWIFQVFRIFQIIRIIRIFQILSIPDFPNFSHYSDYPDCSAFPDFPDFLDFLVGNVWNQLLSDVRPHPPSADRPLAQYFITLGNSETHRLKFWYRLGEITSLEPK